VHGFRDIPTSPSLIHTIVMYQGSKIRAHVKVARITWLYSLRKKGARFFASFDEWTSIAAIEYIMFVVRSGFTIGDVGVHSP
jgi:hypothetical protein